MEPELYTQIPCQRCGRTLSYDPRFEPDDPGTVLCSLCQSLVPCVVCGEEVSRLSYYGYRMTRSGADAHTECVQTYTERAAPRFHSLEWRHMTNEQRRWEQQHYDDHLDDLETDRMFTR